MEFQGYIFYKFAATDDLGKKMFCQLFHFLFVDFDKNAIKRNFEVGLGV